MWLIDDFTIKELSNGVLAIDAKPLKRRDENEAPQMLITSLRADYCELKKKVRKIRHLKVDIVH